MNVESLLKLVTKKKERLLLHRWGRERIKKKLVKYGTSIRRGR